MDIELLIAVAGLLLSFLLFFKKRIITTNSPPNQSHKISVIIPARNEEKTLPLILGDLTKQSFQIHEIICVDDISTDKTADVALAFGATLVSIREKPEDWTGKAYACWRGAKAATGSILLFLDSDVRLSPTALSTLLSAYEASGHVISIQPFHRIERIFEQLSLFFNIIQIAANGLGLPLKNKNVGLSGPVILIEKSTYDAIGGHEVIKGSITDDLALGKVLSKHGIPFELYLGGCEISFRMYASGLRSLLQGWTKNYATGAMKMSLPLLVAVFLWVAACMSPPFHLFLLAFNPIPSLIFIYAALYVFWLGVLFWIIRPIGNFSPLAIVFYPVSLTVFIVVFAVSVFKKLFGLRVTWKARKIELRE